jgi:hypothetical protein
MAKTRLDAVEAIPVILLGQGAQAVARDVARRHGRHAHDSLSRLTHARRELEVLIVEPLLVPSAVPFQRRSPPQTSEPRVDLELPVGAAPERRPAGAEPSRQREGDAP